MQDDKRKEYTEAAGYLEALAEKLEKEWNGCLDRTEEVLKQAEGVLEKLNRVLSQAGNTQGAQAAEEPARRAQPRQREEQRTRKPETRERDTDGDEVVGKPRQVSEGVYGVELQDGARGESGMEIVKRLRDGREFPAVLDEFVEESKYGEVWTTRGPSRRKGGGRRQSAPQSRRRDEDDAPF